MARERLTGVLLVGGASRRFGTPKALARLGGETLAERAWRTLGELCDDRIAVGKMTDGLELPFPVLDDRAGVRAPIAGLVAGLRAAATDVVVALPVDLPLVRASDLRALADGGAHAAVSQTGPLPGAFRKTALPVLERRLRDSRLALRDAVAELGAHVVELDPWRLRNVNTRADLEAAARLERALRAAAEVVARHGVDASEARILQDWNDTIVHLSPAPLVARVATSALRDGASSEACAEVFAREVALARHAAARGAPVLEPAGAPPPGPHVVAGTVLTLWPHVPPGAPEPTAFEAGVALRGLHEGLRDYAGPLPTLGARLDRAAALAADPGSLPTLPAVDRELLARTLVDLRARALGAGGHPQVLHGGPHLANLLATPAGPRWIDLDSVCRGPVEWDLAHLPEAAIAAFPDADPVTLAPWRLLVAADVAVKCWRAYGRAPEVDEAARYHLERLRGETAV